jgi:N-dimethylarginine dimethylaminohydrolase
MTLAITRASLCRRARHFVMCPPHHFDVRYAINAWMDPASGADAAVAFVQWDALRRLYLDLGHRVDLIEPDPDLPDMVFAANGALVIGGRVFGASFAHPERRREAELHRRHLAALRSGSVVTGDSVVTGEIVIGAYVNEGEGDFLVVGDLILAGTGFRTHEGAHREAQAFFGRQVLTLRLVDPRFYHLDTAIAVLDDHTIAYYPGAFSDDSRRLLEYRFPDAMLADEADALALGLNAVSDGVNVILTHGATGLARALRDRGYTTIEVDLSELRKAGGGVKCCTLELHP